MKILYIVHKFWRPTIGGTLNYYADFFNEIVKYHNIRILVPMKKNTKREINTDDNIITVPTGYAVNPNGRFPMYHYHSIYNTKIENIFQSAIDQYHPNIIHFQHFLGLPFRCLEHAINTKIPVVVTIHDFWTLCPRIHFYDTEEKICKEPRKGAKCLGCAKGNLRVRENIRTMMKDIFFVSGRRYNFFTWRYSYVLSLLKRTSVLIVPSNFSKNIYMGAGVVSPKIEVVPFSLNIPQITPQYVDIKTKIRFGFVGTLSNHKGVLDILKAFTFINKERAELLLYGSNGYTSLRKNIPQSELPHIKFMGTFTKQEMPTVYSSMDYLIVPSRCYETYSFVARESFQYGTPVIAPSHSVFTELIRNKHNGFLFQPLNWHSLAEVLDGIISKNFRIDPSNIKGVMPSFSEHINTILSIYNSLLIRND